MKTEFKEYDSLIELMEEVDREEIQGNERKEIFNRFMNLRARMRGIPYGGGFELTPHCNFDCKMCYVHLTKNQLPKNEKILSVEQWIDIMQQAINAGMMHADLTGGECLSYPGFRDVYLFLKTHGVRVSVLTNGQLITEDIADLFKKYPPEMVQITVYGYDNDSYEAVTGHRAFEDVKKAISLLKSKGIHLFLAVTPNRFMQGDVHSFLEFLRSQEVRYGIGTGSLPAREDTGRSLAEYEPEAELYVKLHKDDIEYRKSLQANVNLLKKKIDRIPKGFQPINKMPCSSGQATFHINWKGEMQPCIPFHKITRSVLDYGFDDCWKWIKQTMAAYELPQECCTCDKASVCVSCPAERTLGILNGAINKSVCNRYECFVRKGILEIPPEQNCR